MKDILGSDSKKKEKCLTCKGEGKIGSFICTECAGSGQAENVQEKKRIKGSGGWFSWIK